MLLLDRPGGASQAAADPLLEPRRAGRPPSAVFGLVPVVLVLVLGAVQLSRGLAFWYDEDYTLLAVRTPLPTLLSGVWDASPLVSWLTVAPSFNAPWYVLMHGWSAVFGTSAIALRVPALLCSAAAAGVVALIARRQAGDLAGMTAGLLCATAPSFAQQAVEARSYGAGELAIALTVLFLLRRREEEGRGRVGLALSAGTAGLLHWFTLPVLAGLGAWSLVSRGRRGLGDAATIALASVPALALVALQLHGGGDGTPITQRVGLTLPYASLKDFAKGAWWLELALVLGFAIALVRTRWRGLLTGWVLAPLALVTAIELVRPVFFGRYLLFALLGLSVGAALGVASLPARWRAWVAVGLVGLSVVTCLPRLQSSAREHPDMVVAALEAEQVAGQPVAAGDGRAALELAEQVDQEGSRLAADLLLRPAHLPSGGTARVAWLVRSGSGAKALASPNDAYLAAGGWHLAATTVWAGGYGDLTLERWAR